MTDALPGVHDKGTSNGTPDGALTAEVVKALIEALSDTALRSLAGKVVFGRAKDYVTSNAITVIAEEGGVIPTIYAEIIGSDIYLTEVSVRDGSVGGGCDCPHAEDGTFCKHQVALAMVWRGLLGTQHSTPRSGGSTGVAADAPMPSPILSDRTARLIAEEVAQHQALEAFLKSRQVSELASKLMDLANRDSGIAKELNQWMRLDQPVASVAEHKTLVTEMLAVGRSFVPASQSHKYVQRAESVLPVLDSALKTDPAGALALTQHAMRRTWAAFQQVDDSYGNVGELCRSVAARWVKAVQANGPQPAAFGAAYLKLRLDDPFGCFDTDAVETAMGAAALTRFRQKLREAWRKAKDEVLAHRPSAGGRASSQYMAALQDVHSLSDSAQLFTLEWMHLQQLESQGDFEAALSVVKEDLNTGTEHVRVVQFLEQHGRMRDAFAHAEAAIKAFPDDWLVQDCALRAYERDGWAAEAFDLRMRRFRARPGPETYLAMLTAAGQAGQDVEATRATILGAIAEQEIELTQSRTQRTGYTRFGAQRLLGPGPNERDVSLRASLLCAENRWDEALQLVQPPAYCIEHLLEHIALQLHSTHWEQAVVLLQRAFNSAMQRATSPYRHELDLVRKILLRMGNDTTRRHWLAHLASMHKAKRNFVRDLPVV
ncbi:SWIM zinc finger family protein [Ottowia thiooxydans]|uniref:SWIM zinc finger family protein n=1 Tax=Ottowia thiooxydans TaxID=219182 RepID=UPI0003F52EBB|nr:hypothetical protein [Ottowia thiooxydans]